MTHEIPPYDRYGIFPEYPPSERLADWCRGRARNPRDSIHAITLLCQLTEKPSFDLIPHLIRQREWSAKTFGEHGDRTVGLIRHIQKELEEIRQDPRDLIEWIDVVILAFDGAWRAGYTAEEIAAALDRKQRINMARAWPDISSANLAEPIEHIGG